MTTVADRRAAAEERKSARQAFVDRVLELRAEGKRNGEIAALLGCRQMNVSNVTVPRVGRQVRVVEEKWTTHNCRRCGKVFRVLKSNERKRWRASYGERLMEAGIYCDRQCYHEAQRTNDR